MSIRSALALILAIVLAGPIGADEDKSKTVEELAAALKPSVCVITTHGRDGKGEGLGTGFVVSADGLIATNAHVIGEGRPVSVEFADGTKYDAVAVHAHDRKRDLAVIRVTAKGLKPIPLGDSDALKDGLPVVALGNPKGLKYSVVSGVVSSIRVVEGRKLIQIAMPVEPGNSGGPIVDMRGQVQGIVTLKSLVTQNLGFAVTVNELKPLLAKPNPVPMAAWATIGALDPDDWKAEMGARWTQRAGRINVEGTGSGFGGRSICIAQRPAPTVAFEVAVAVKLDDERGAAGLLFRHDGTKHYGFYPTGGRLRLTRFDGADVYSWKILADVSSPHYKSGEWNVLRVRIEKDRVRCFVNGRMAIETDDAEWTGGQIGLAKFRETKAEFKQFRIGTDLAATPANEKAVRMWIAGIAPDKPLPAGAFDQFAAEKTSPAVLRKRARELEAQAARLSELAANVHQRRVYDELTALLARPEETIDLIHAALLLARLDNEDLDVDAYRTDVDRMAKKLAASLPKDADEATKLKALNAFFFETRGFHGSRGDYYHRSNSYLNEVLDDREGLPITLGVIYMELARRIGVEVVGIGLPGHFIVRHVPKKGEGKFIDPFERGEAMTAEDALKKASEYVGREVDEAVLKAVPKKAIIGRMLQNLLRVAQNERDVDGGLRYLEGILRLDPTASQNRMMRAGMYLSKGMKAEALADVQFLIDHPTDDLDMKRLSEFRRAIESER